jgi:hypothetical protein
MHGQSSASKGTHPICLVLGNSGEHSAITQGAEHDEAGSKENGKE